jgi:hypothetical protein
MNDFAKIFADTAAFLRAKDVAPEIADAKRSKEAAVIQFNQKTGLELPESFWAFHTQFSNGYEFEWCDSESECRGEFSIPSLSELVQNCRYWQRNVQDFLDDPHSLDRCVKPPFREEAFTIWRRMLRWVPFWGEANGDWFCLDTASGRIVYHQHDWFDGFGGLAKTNGIVAGENLEHFLQNWSRFCFQPNLGLWWGKFAKFGEIRWEAEYFDSRFDRGASLPPASK